MMNSFPGFTVLVERAMRLTCLVGVVALAACGGGGEEADDAGAGAVNVTTMSDQLSGGTRVRTQGIVLSEKGTSTAPLLRSTGVVLSEKMVAPTEEVDVEDEDEDAER